MDVIKKFSLICSTAVLGVCAMTNRAHAQTTSIRLAVELGRPQPKLPVSAICSSVNGKDFAIQRLGGEIGFANSQAETLTVSGKLLPTFGAGETFSEGVFHVEVPKTRSRPCDFTLVYVDSGQIEHSLPKLKDAGMISLASGDGWLVTDKVLTVDPQLAATIPTQTTPLTTMSTASTSPDAGTSSIISEETGSTTILKDLCFRPFDPSGLSRYSSGIVTWNRDNPAQMGFSIKDENTNSEYVSSLRCPKGPYQSEYLLDGVHRIL